MEKLNILAEVCSKRLAEEYPANRVEYTGLGGEAAYSKPNALDKLKDLIREKGGSDEKLIIEKTLYDTDVKKGQNRLSIPLKQILSDDFLDDDEKRKILIDGVVLGFTEPSLKETTMLLKKWDYTTASSYVLVTNWHKVVKKNGLKRVTPSRSGSSGSRDVLGLLWSKFPEAQDHNYSSLRPKPTTPLHIAHATVDNI